MQANIIAENKIVYQGEVLAVTLPGSEGELTILPNHLPLITSLNKGKIKVKEINGQELFFEIEKGVLEVQPQEINVLVSL
ncbi:MAG: ATP synthase F1 subunit epsilon [bacterium]